jgi:hypothetical protein
VVTPDDALRYTARVMPELLFDVLAGMPEEIQESTLAMLREDEEGENNAAD